MLNTKKGFTLVELIIAILIVSIIGTGISGIFIFFMRNTILLPNQMNAQQAAEDAMEILIEGDDQAQGLRFISPSDLVDIQNDYIRFTDPQGETIRFGKDSDGRIQRRIGSNSWEIIPYYADDILMVTSQAGSNLFEYFDGGEQATTTPANVRRIKINLLGQSGTGDIDSWEGAALLSSSVKLYNFSSVSILEVVYQPRWRRYRISFRVNDPDTRRVRWYASVSPSGAGNLSPNSGQGNVPYSQTTYYYPSPWFSGTATVTIYADDGNGNVAIDTVDIQV